MGCAASILTSSPASPSSEYPTRPILGFVAYGKVSEVYRLHDKRPFALKEFEITRLTPEDAKVVKNELLIYQKLEPHPFIMNLYRAFRDNYSVSFLVEHLSGGDLRSALNSGRCFTEHQVAYIIACVGSALQYLHSLNIVHGDIKPDNIVFTGDGIPKLRNFGASCALSFASDAEMPKSRGGTQQDIIPDALGPDTSSQDYQADFWSLGVVMYELLFLKLPFELTIPSLKPFSDHKKFQTTFECSSTESVISTRTLPANSGALSSPQSIIDNPDLAIFIPNTTSTKEHISSECRDILNFLLFDVRNNSMDMRASGYRLFISHEWFQKFNIHECNLESITSPITIDVKDISGHSSSIYTHFNFFDQVLGVHPLPHLDSIYNILGDITYISPHFPYFSEHYS